MYSKVYLTLLSNTKRALGSSVPLKNTNCKSWYSTDTDTSTGTGKKTKKSEIAPKNILPLHKRGIFQDIFPPASVKLPDRFKKKQCFYCGFDPTADSLHVGNLLSIMSLLHCQRAGHEVIAVIGTATAKAGDPSGHTKDRQILNNDTLNKNAERIAECIERIFENHALHLYDGRLTKVLPDMKILFNHEWYDKISAVEFITTVCQKFRMGHMMDKRYIRDRIESKTGLSLTEFMYQVLQAYDWMYLHKHFNCSFQIGGIDQLGNIDAGQELISRTSKDEVYGLFTPILTTPRGEKLGKTAGNSVWLCPSKTSPFEFYQYFYRQPDTVVESFLKYFTFMDLKQVESLMMDHRRKPELQRAQLALARNICKIVHGEKGLRSAELCSRVLYQGSLEDIEQLSENEIESTFAGTDIVRGVLEPETTLYDLTVTIAKAIPPGGKGENIITDGGVRVNGVVVDHPQQILMPDIHVLKNDLTLLTVGKRRHFVVRWTVPRLKYQLDDEGELPPNQEIPGLDVDKLLRANEPE